MGIDASEWWSLFIFIPVLGGILYLMLLFLLRTEEGNKFGDQPVVASKRYYLMLPMLYLICLLIGKIGEILFI